MKRYISYLFLPFSIGLQETSAQDDQRVFGDISNEEIHMTLYAKDPDAKAVVLFDVGESKFIDTERGYDIRFTRHKRIKIFDKAAFNHAEVSIPFYTDGYGRTEVVKSIRATTYNYLNGKLSRQNLDLSAIFEERFSQTWRNKKFVFPNVQEGSIIEFEYVLETPFHFNLPDWVFQDKIPTIYSEYEVRMIPFYEYEFIAQGISRFDHQRSVVAEEKREWGEVVNTFYGQNVGSGIEFEDYIHTYVLKDVPAFQDEHFISSINDYIIKMDFQLAKFHSPTGGSSEIISTWAKLNEALLKHEKFGRYLKGSGRIANKILANDLKTSGLSQRDKSMKIIEYVKNHYTWDGYYSKYASQSPKEFTANKVGNSADINLFLLALLNSARIEAKALILSTREHGKIKTDYPFDHFTNYVVVLVNVEQPFLTDATDHHLPYDRLPTRCFNDKGLIVSGEEEPVWIEIENNIPSIEKNSVVIEIDPETNRAFVDISVELFETDAHVYRSSYQNDTTKLKELYSSKIGKIHRIETFGYDEVSKPYVLSLQAVKDTEALGRSLVVNPFLNLAPSSNVLTQKNRTYPVDFIYPRKKVFEIDMKIPHGYAAVEVPEPFIMKNDLADIELEYSISNGVLKVIGNYYFKKPIYGAKEYSRIKFYMSTIVKKFNEEIVLEKT